MYQREFSWEPEGESTFFPGVELEMQLEDEPIINKLIFIPGWSLLGYLIIS